MGKQPDALKRYWANKNKSKTPLVPNTPNTCRFGCSTHSKLKNGMCPSCANHPDAKRYNSN
jgi:hypothetical protein